MDLDDLEIRGTQRNVILCNEVTKQVIVTLCLNTVYKVESSIVI